MDSLEIDMSLLRQLGLARDAVDNVRLDVPETVEHFRAAVSAMAETVEVSHPALGDFLR